MNFPVIKGTSYALIHAGQMLLHHGTTPTMARRNDSEIEYVKKLQEHLRTFGDVVSYPPNQVFIGNMTVDQLREIPRPWYGSLLPNADREGKYGDILAEDEFIGLIKIADVFNLVVLEESFQRAVMEKLTGDSSLVDTKQLEILKRTPGDIKEIQGLIDKEGAQPLFFGGNLVGCVKKAHDFDFSLSSTAMLENLVSKASAAYALKLLLKKSNLHPGSVDYIIECSEEACGDMNQRGGGNFAKAIGEMCGCLNATGSDTRSFCSAPVHGLIQAGALVQSGVYKNVVVLGGGSSAKLGMNSREHLKKGMPVLEDMLGAFAIHVSENDGKNPIIRIDAVGRLKIGSGSSPQAVMEAIIIQPLDKLGYKILDIDRYAAELQNPEITEPAGAGDVPLANYKMIAALGIKRGELEREKLLEYVGKFGMPGFVPTQGHVPSGVPFVGPCRDLILAGKMKRGMIIGKGSLFLGRLTNLFDGISFIIEENPGSVPGLVGEEDMRRILAKIFRESADAIRK